MFDLASPVRVLFRERSELEIGIRIRIRNGYGNGNGKVSNFPPAWRVLWLLARLLCSHHRSLSLSTAYDRCPFY